MKRIWLLILIIILLPVGAQAYTLVLKNGQRIEVAAKYRIVNNVAVFTQANGKRFSVELNNINIDATEAANGESAGAFAQHSSARSNNNNNTAIMLSEREVPQSTVQPKALLMTTADFEPYHVYREIRETQQDNYFQRKISQRGETYRRKCPPKDQQAFVQFNEQHGDRGRCRSNRGFGQRGGNRRCQKF